MKPLLLCKDCDHHAGGFCLRDQVPKTDLVTGIVSMVGTLGCISERSWETSTLSRFAFGSGFCGKKAYYFKQENE